VDDPVNKVLTLRFQDALAINTIYTVRFSCADPNDREKDGFMYLVDRGIKSFEIEIEAFGTGLIYFIQSDPLVMFYTQGLATVYPHRGMERVTATITSYKMSEHI